MIQRVGEALHREVYLQAGSMTAGEGGWTYESIREHYIPLLDEETVETIFATCSNDCEKASKRLDKLCEFATARTPPSSLLRKEAML
eukprot:g7805.t1